MASSDGIGNIAHDFHFLRQVAPIPEDIQDRRVEITGPVDRKMVINALNSGANVYMADFEDSNAPTWCACKGSFMLFALRWPCSWIVKWSLPHVTHMPRPPSFGSGCTMPSAGIYSDCWNSQDGDVNVLQAEPN